MLTAQQIAHYNTFGFLVLKQLFSADEAAIIEREAEEIFAESQPPDVPDMRRAVQPFLERKPFLSTLPDDDRIYNIGVGLVGPDFVLEGTEGHLQSGDTPWHGGLLTEGFPHHIKIVFYPEALTRETGCLRVMPGTQHPSPSDPLAVLRDRTYDPNFMPFGMTPTDLPSVAIESRPGDVVVFTESLLHASFGGRVGRHQHAVSFMAKPRSDAEVAAVHAEYENRKYGLRPAESYVNSDRPRIRRMVSQLVEWGFETWKL